MFLPLYKDRIKSVCLNDYSILIFIHLFIYFLFFRIVQIKMIFFRIVQVKMRLQLMERDIMLVETEKNEVFFTVNQSYKLLPEQKVASEATILLQ